MKKPFFLIVKGTEIDFLYSSFIALRLSLNNEFQLRLINLRMIVSLFMIYSWCGIMEASMLSRTEKALKFMREKKLREGLSLFHWISRTRKQWMEWRCINVGRFSVGSQTFDVGGKIKRWCQLFIFYWKELFFRFLFCY